MASTVWRGFLTFGLISIPVRLFRAARAERVSFRRVYKAGPALAPEPEDEEPETAHVQPARAGKKGRQPEPAPGPVLVSRTAPAAAPPPAPVFEPVQQAAVRRGSDELLEARSVVKGYEYEKGRYLEVDPEELKELAPKTATEMQIAEFVRLSEIDAVYFETSYYVNPEQAGEKAYALLYRALQDAALVALAQFAMHNREHVIVVRPGKHGLIAHTMFYSSEVRGDEEFRADVSAVSQKELDLAHKLISSLAAPFEPGKYRDTYREKLEEMLVKKMAGQPVSAPAAPSVKTSVVDITEALQRSLAALKKPATKASAKRKATHG